VQSTKPLVFHPGKDLAVSLPKLLLGFFRINPEASTLSDCGVTARTSHITMDGRYPLPCSLARASLPLGISLSFLGISFLEFPNKLRSYKLIS